MQRRTAIQRICADLSLPQGDAFTQDWAYELGEEYRTEDYLQRYLSAYRNPDYGPTERDVLVQLILDIVNDMLTDAPAVGAHAWAATVGAIGKERLLTHESEIERYSCGSEPLEDSYALTPFVRALVRGGS